MNNTSKLNKNSKLNTLAVAIILVGLTASVWAQGSPGGQPMSKGPAGGPPGGPPNVPPGSPGSPGGPPVGAKAPAVPSGAPAGKAAGDKRAGGPTGAPHYRNPNALRAKPSPNAGSDLSKGDGVLGTAPDR